MKKIHYTLLKTITKKQLRADANQTTCLTIYQRKAPQNLKKFKK